MPYSVNSKAITESYIFKAVPVAEWLRILIFSALNHCFTAVGLSLARVTCEKSQVLLAGGQVVFLRDLPFSTNLTIDTAQNE